MSTPASRLRHAREVAGFSKISDAVSQFGWKRAAYSHHENGLRDFGVQDAIKYSRAYRVSAWWLLSGIVEPRDPAELTSDEASLLAKYRAASETLREAAHAVLTPKPKGAVADLFARRKRVTS